MQEGSTVSEELMQEVSRFIDLCASDAQTKELIEEKGTNKETLTALYFYLRKHLSKQDPENQTILFNCFYHPQVLSLALELFDGVGMVSTGYTEKETLFLFQNHVRTCFKLGEAKVVFQ